MGFKIFTFALASLFLLIDFTTGQLSLQSDRKEGFLGKNYAAKGTTDQTEPLNEAVKNDLSLEWRLKGEVIPHHYSLKLTPILESGHEDGMGEQWKIPAEVIISIEAKIETSKITLHSKSLVYSKEDVKVFDASSNPIGLTDVVFEEEHNFVHLTLDSPLLAGTNYTIQITYEAMIQEELHGLYRSTYTIPTTGEERTIAVSQMEALNARELFPCFDEPSYKAVFEVTVGRLEKHVVLANGKSAGNTSMEAEGHPGWWWENFEPTVPMSTYLFALVVSEFKYTEAAGNILPETIVRTYAPEHDIIRKGGDYASEKAEIILAHFEEYFGEKYPMSKMDMAAAPSFYFGAMENYGLNIYRESRLLYFPDETTEAERLRLTNIVSHELAHQWFGNLVSPAWWTHIWLNEGMATFSEFIGMEKTIAEFKPWDLFVTDVLQNALSYDGLKDYSHPLKIVEQDWITKEAMSWFDTLTYEKGASLARMMQSVLSETVMQEGLREYQTKMKFSSAVQDDLFDSLNKAALSANKLPSGLTIKEIMDTWTLQAGFPLVTVSQSEQGLLQVKQGETFLNVPKTLIFKEKFGDDTSLDQWYIPLSIATFDSGNFNPEPETWLIQKSLTLDNETFNSHWIIVNAGAQGYYRVVYDSVLQQRIIDQLHTDHKKINHLSRSQIIDDSFASAAIGYATMEGALSFTRYLRSGIYPEVEMIVWTPVLKNMEKALNLFGSSGMLQELKLYLLPAINRAISATGGVGALTIDSKGYNVLRHTLFLDWACALSDRDCHEYALELVNQWRQIPTSNPVQRDLKPIVYCAAIASGGNDVFDFISLQYHSNTITSKQQTLLMNALGCVTDTELINQLLNGTVTDGYFVQKSHGPLVLQQLAGNLEARALLLEFLKTHSQELITFYGDSTPIIDTVNALSGFLSTNEELALVEALAERESIDLNASIEDIKQNIEWIQNVGVKIQSFIKVVLDEDARTTTSVPTENTEEPPVESTPPSTSKGFMSGMNWKLISVFQMLITFVFFSLV